MINLLTYRELRSLRSLPNRLCFLFWRQITIRRRGDEPDAGGQIALAISFQQQRPGQQKGRVP